MAPEFFALAIDRCRGSVLYGAVYEIGPLLRTCIVVRRSHED